MLCPKAWKIPPTTGTGSFTALYSAYSNNYTNFQKAFRAPLNGCMLADNNYPRGSTGCLWASNWETNGEGNISVGNFYITTSAIYPSDGSRGVYGIAVRCILK